jgi:hypothetical protein
VHKYKNALFKEKASISVQTYALLAASIAELKIYIDTLITVVYRKFLSIHLKAKYIG